MTDKELIEFLEETKLFSDIRKPQLKILTSLIDSGLQKGFEKGYRQAKRKALDRIRDDLDSGVLSVNNTSFIAQQLGKIIIRDGDKIL